MYGAWAIGVAMVIHGLAGSYNPKTNPASTDMYRLGFILAFLTGSLSYLLFCYIWPIKTYPDGREHEPRSFEYLGPTDGYFEEGDVIIEGRSGSEEAEDALHDAEKTAKASTVGI